MNAKAKLAGATSTIALVLFTPVAAIAGDAPAQGSGAAVVALPTPVDMNASSWVVDRTPTESFGNAPYQGRNALKIGIAPPANGQSFYNWQGYHQVVEGPSGSSSLRGDLWIENSWAADGGAQYVRTGIWGSLLPQGTDDYVDSQAIFPIISFTNMDGQGRLEVWDTTANPDGGWVDLGVDSAAALDFGAWNRFETRVLPGSDKIEYYVNDQLIYTWNAPVSETGGTAEELWAIYLNPRNNGETTFDSYWSDLTTSNLVLDGGMITEAPNGIEVVSGGVGTVTIAEGVQAQGVTTGVDSQATLAFSANSGVQTTANGAASVLSAEGSPIALENGTVTASGTNAFGLLATGEGSKILTVDTDVAVTGAGSYGAAVLDGGEIGLTGGSVKAVARSLSAVGGKITATGTALENVVASNNVSETGAAYALDGGEIVLTGGTVNVSGGRNNGLIALRGGTITSSEVAITASGDRSRGVYAGADSNGAGAVTISGGSIATNGLLSHGLFTKRESGSTGDAVATIGASDVAITVNGTDANGIYADVGGVITVTGGSVTTLGLRGVGLHAQASDDNLTGAGLLTASNVTVTTAGSNAYGGYAEKGGQLTINGGTIATTGSKAYGLYARDAGSKITSSADVSTGGAVEWTFGAFATLGATIDLTGGSITTNGFRAHGLLAEQGGTITSAADVTTHGDRAHGVQAGTTEGAGTITLDGVAVTTTGAMAYGLLAYGGSTISGTADISTAGDGSFGVSADGDGTITLSGGTVATAGAGSHALQSVRDDRFVNAGILSASGVAATTSGAGAYGALADEGGSVTLTGGSIATSGEGSHALVASGPADYNSQLSATGVAVTTTGANAAGAAIDGKGSISLSGGSIAASGPALLAETSTDGTASFALVGTIASSTSSTLLKVDRTNDTQGTGIVSLSLTGGAQARGTIDDLTAKTSGRTDVLVDASRLEGAILGVDALTLSGGATWVATGADGIGTTTIGTGGATISTSSDVELDGKLLGAGALAKTGSATLLLSGDGSTFAGTTTISGGKLLVTGALNGAVVINPAGTLQIGDGTSDGELSGSTLNNGTMIFDQVADYDYTGSLSGTGGLIKEGSGLLLLSGDYQYKGSTEVRGGRIQVASQLDEDTDLVIEGGTIDLSDKDQTVAGLSGGGGELLVGTSGQITIDQSGDSVFAGSIVGSSPITVTGGGQVNLTGNSDYTGTMTVSGATVRVNGSLRGSMFIQSGGSLGGNGLIAAVRLAVGASLTPGNSIGTLHVTGNAVFDAGSIYEVEVDADGNGDKIIVGGSAQINGGTVSVLAAAGNYRNTSDYVILTAAGGVTGTFATTDVDLPFLDSLLSYSTTDVTLTLVRNDRDFAQVAVTPNQTAVAIALDAGAHDSGLYRAVAGQTDANGARVAFDALSGEIWATSGTLVVDQSRRMGELALGRMQQADTVSHALSFAGSAAVESGNGTAIWGQGIGSWNKLKGDGNAARTTQHQWGFVTGLDGGLGDWRIGAAFSHSQSKMDVAARNDSATITSDSLMGYAGGGFGNLRVRAGASLGWHKVDGARLAQFPNYRDQLSGHHRDRTASAFGELSYLAPLGNVLLEPFAGLNFVHLKSRGFTETGGAAALTMGEVTRDVTFSTVGARLGAVLPVSAETAITPRVSVAWQHGFGDVKSKATNLLPTGEAFTIAGLPVAKDSASIEAGAQANILPGGSIGLSYVGNVSDRWADHGLKLGFSYSF